MRTRDWPAPDDAGGGGRDDARGAALQHGRGGRGEAGHREAARQQAGGRDKHSRARHQERQQQVRRPAAHGLPRGPGAAHMPCDGPQQRPASHHYWPGGYEHGAASELSGRTRVHMLLMPGEAHKHVKGKEVPCSGLLRRQRPMSLACWA